jgi:hypothetical protein
MPEAAPSASTVDNAPPPDPDTEKYAALARELEIEPEGGEPETPAEPPAEPAEPDKAKPEYVPYTEHENVQKALREARERAKASDERLNGIMELVNRSRAERQQQKDEPKKDEPQLPDVEEDPIGHFTAKIAALEQQLTEARTGTRQTAEQFQAAQQQQQLFQLVQRSETDILDPKNPDHKADYWDACGYLEGQRIKELDRMYPDAAPYAVQYAQQQGFRTPRDLKLATLNHDRQAVAVQALQLGLSPAQVYYNLALDRGYQAKANGKAPADKGKNIIEMAKRGTKAATTISGGSGRKGAQDMSIKDLSDLFIEDPEAADKVWEEMRRQGRLG